MPLVPPIDLDNIAPNTSALEAEIDDLIMRACKHLVNYAELELKVRGPAYLQLGKVRHRREEITPRMIKKRLRALVFTGKVLRIHRRPNLYRAADQP